MIAKVIDVPTILPGTAAERVPCQDLLPQGTGNNPSIPGPRAAK
ncbi:MAG: hypothetical protein XD51_0511 [Moorella sp. 60_41]|nr:MAG: hypothetical protein XD51_0511 [Moorella sp. 60_41]